MVYHSTVGDTYPDTIEQESVYHYNYNEKGQLTSVNIEQGPSVINGSVFDSTIHFEVSLHWSDYYFFQAPEK